MNFDMDFFGISMSGLNNESGTISILQGLIVFSESIEKVKYEKNKRFPFLLNKIKIKVNS